MRKSDIFSFIFVLIGVLFQQVAFGFMEQTNKYEAVDNKGNTVIYESKKNGVGLEEGIHGELSIFSKNNELIYFQKYMPEPGCLGSKYSSPQLIPKKSEWGSGILIICGDGGSGGHHNTIFFINNGKIIGDIEIGDFIDPKITWIEANKTYQIFSLYRMGSQYQGLDSFFMAYQWSGHNRFNPTFNEYSRNAYWEHYLDGKKNLIERVKKSAKAGWSHIIPDGVLASLIATSDKKLICSELQKPPFLQFSKKDIQSSISFNKKYGYPDFDILTCGEK